MDLTRDEIIKQLITADNKTLGQESRDSMTALTLIGVWAIGIATGLMIAWWILG